MRTSLQVAADTVPWLIAGWISAIGTQASVGWWLNSSRGVWVTGTVFAVVAYLVLFFSRRGHWVRLGCLWGGAQAGLGYVLFRSGEGLSLFPIVLVIGGLVSAMAMGLGGSLGWIGGRFVQHRS